MNLRRLLATGLAATVVVACTGGSSDGASPSADTATASVIDAGAEATYGAAPNPGDGVRLADDVVIVGGGADSVRSVSADGIVWTIDADAPDADRLTVGSVMFLTGSGLGRVAKLEPQGDALAVTLMPVDLTEVIEEGSFAWEQGLDPSQLTVRVTPDAPGALSEPTTLLAANAEPVDVPGPGQSLAARAPGARAPSTPPGTGKLPPAVRGGAGEFTLGDWSVEPSVSSTQAALKFGYTKSGLTLGGEIAIGWKDLKVIGNLTVSGGRVNSGLLSIEGLNSLALKIIGGSEVGQSGNIKARVEVPVEINVPAMVGGIPFVMSFRWKFIVETAFSAKNSTIEAEGAYRLVGPLVLGFSQGVTTLSVPTATRTKSLLNSLQGISVGVNGIVVAAQLKILFGIGGTHVMTGPFVAVNVSTGLTNGSSIGLIRCKQGSLTVEGASGVGLTVSPAAGSALAFLAEQLKIKGPSKLDLELGTKRTIFSRSGVVPDVPLCRGPG